MSLISGMNPNPPPVDITNKTEHTLPDCISFVLGDGKVVLFSEATVRRVASLGNNFFTTVMTGRKHGVVKERYFIDVDSKIFIKWIAPFIRHGLFPVRESIKNEQLMYHICAVADALLLTGICEHLIRPPPPILEKAIGPDVWKSLNFSVDKVPPVPKHLLKNYDENQILGILPKGMTGNLFLKLVQPTDGDAARQIRTPDSEFFKQYGDVPVSETYWFLMPKKMLDGSMGTCRDRQLVLAESVDGCQAPTVLEAMTSIMLWYVKYGERLYSDSPWRATCCKETVTIDGRVHKMVVGAFSLSGLFVEYHYVDDYYAIGIGPLRK